MAVAALVLVTTGAHRTFGCREATASITALPPSFGPGARTVTMHSACPTWAILPDRWIVTLEAGGRTDEVYRSFGPPWPGRVEARGQGPGRKLIIQLEPRSLDGTGGAVEIVFGADGRPISARR